MRVGPSTSPPPFGRYALLVVVFVVIAPLGAPLVGASAPPSPEAVSPAEVPPDATGGPRAQSTVRVQENNTSTTAPLPGEPIDGDGDGTVDGTALDRNGDGVVDGIDADGDGRSDALVRGDTDTDGDGQPEGFYNPGPAPVGSIQPGTGVVGPGAIVFQGEQDTRMVNFAETTLIGVPDRGAGGVPLDLNQTVPPQQPFGVYADSQDNVLVVNRPRVSNLEILGESGDEITGGEVQSDEFVLVQASFNFLAASHAELFPLDSSSVEIRDANADLSEVAARSPAARARVATFLDLVPDDREDTTQVRAPGIQSGLQPKDTAYLLLDLDALEKEDIYTLVARAEDDKPLGGLSEVEDAEQAAPFRMISATEAQVEFDSGTRFVQGEFATFRVDESTVGRRHAVAIRASTLRRDLTDSTVDVEQLAATFRDRDDLVDRGVLVRTEPNGSLQVRRRGLVRGDAVEWVFAVVVTDDRGFGLGVLDTGRLDDTRVTLGLFREQPTSEAAVATLVRDPQSSVDELTLRVDRATFTLDEPGATYVAGDDVEVHGTASIGVDDVAIYARDEGDWEFVLTSPVDTDGVFDEHEVTLSERSETLAIPGTHRIGLIDLEDADKDGSGAIDTARERRLSPLDFRGATSQRTIRVRSPDLRATFETRAGEVAVGDGIDWNGTATGPDELLVVFVDDRGNVFVQPRSVGTDGVFTGEDVRLGGRLDESRVTALALSPGRDGVFGDGESFGEFRTFVARLDAGARPGEARLTRSQVLDLIAESSVAEDGSDDLVVRRDFRLTEPKLSLRDAVPVEQPERTGIADPFEAGEAVLLRGTSNRDPEDSTITVRLVSDATGNVTRTAVVDDWPANGTWTARIVLPQDLQPGAYTLQASDGDAATRVTVDVVASTGRATTAPTTRPTTENGTSTTGTGTVAALGASTEASMSVFAVLSLAAVLLVLWRQE